MDTQMSVGFPTDRRVFVARDFDFFRCARHREGRRPAVVPGGHAVAVQDCSARFAAPGSPMDQSDFRRL